MTSTSEQPGPTYAQVAEHGSVGQDPGDAQSLGLRAPWFNTLDVQDPEGRTWRINVQSFTPWGFIDGTAPRAYGSQNHGLIAELVGSLLLPLLVWAAQWVVRLATWPIWWAWRRASGRGLTLLVLHPCGEWIEGPADLGRGSARLRRAELARRIAAGVWGPKGPGGLGRSEEFHEAQALGLEGGAPGQPFVRRRQSVEARGARRSMSLGQD